MARKVTASPEPNGPRKVSVIEWKDIASLTKAEYNPTRREKMGIKSLADSISRLGLLDPIKIDKEGNVIDGHRRIAACVLLGWTEIQCIVLSCESKEEAYAELNANSRRMTPIDALGIYLKNPAAVSFAYRQRFAVMKDTLGMRLLRRLHKEQLGLSAYSNALQIRKFIGWEGNARLVQIIEWFIESKMAYMSRVAMQGGAITPAKMAAAIDNKKELTRQFR